MNIITNNPKHYLRREKLAAAPKRELEPSVTASEAEILYCLSLGATGNNGGYIDWSSREYNKNSKKPYGNTGQK